MLIPQDELLCHQLTTTFDHVAQSDLRWTERVVVYGFDLNTGANLMTGMARYPNRNVVDAYAMATVDGKAHVVRTSREISAAVDGLTSWSVNNYTYRIVEPLQSVQAVLEPSPDYDLALDVTFNGNFPCYEQEPAFFRHRGRVQEDARRFYQNGNATGSLTVAGQPFDITEDGWYFARDHSWGVRHGGGGGNLTPAAVLQPTEIPDGVLYFMGIFQFDDRVVHFAQREDADGAIWHYEGEMLYPLAADRPSRRIAKVEHNFTFRDELPRVVSGGEVVVHVDDGSTQTISFTPVSDFWPGMGGYDEYRGYASGHWRGSSYTDSFVADTTDPAEIAQVSMLSETFVTATSGGAKGHGLVEMVFVGRNARYGYAGY